MSLKTHNIELNQSFNGNIEGDLAKHGIEVCELSPDKMKIGIISVLTTDKLNNLGRPYIKKVISL